MLPAPIEAVIVYGPSRVPVAIIDARPHLPDFGPAVTDELSRESGVIIRQPHRFASLEGGKLLSISPGIRSCSHGQLLGQFR